MKKEKNSFLQILMRYVYKGIKYAFYLLVIIFLLLVFYKVVGIQERMPEIRNARRSLDGRNITDAVYQFTIDNQGNVPDQITNEFKEICKTGAGDCTGLLDLSILVESNYIDQLPEDPQNESKNGTGYSIKRTSASRVTVKADYSELGIIINVTR